LYEGQGLVTAATCEAVTERQGLSPTHGSRNVGLYKSYMRKKSLKGYAARGVVTTDAKGAGLQRLVINFQRIVGEGDAVRFLLS